MCSSVSSWISYPLSTYSVFRHPLPNLFKYRTLPKPLATAHDSPSARTAAPFPLRCRPSLKYSSSFPTKLPHMSTYPTSSSLQSRSTIPLTAILFEFLYPWILFPHTGNIPDKMICPNLACFVFFSSFLYFSTIAVVPSLSVLFVPTCTSMVPPFPLPMIFSTLSLCHMLYSCSR